MLSYLSEVTEREGDSREEDNEEEIPRTSIEATYKPVAALAPPIAQGLAIPATVTSATSGLTTTTAAITTTVPTTTTTTSSTTVTTTTSTTTTTTTKSTSTTTTTAPPRSSPAVPAYTLLCTVSNVFGSASVVPTDGLCDLLFYDSLSRGGQNKLGHGYNSGLRFFIRLSTVLRATGIGVSFHKDSNEVSARAYSRSFESAVVDLWNRGVSHFGVLDIYGKTEERVIIACLKLLQKIYSIIRTKETAQRPCYTVFGARFENPVHHQAILHTKFARRRQRTQKSPSVSHFLTPSATSCLVPAPDWA
ncbi:hypothetical protein V5799_033129 [Amblyomma americanum]|uniref:Uncharacterized protein n=1 Tax=Amblyomma americanum TaxID=6943 RepID=A0AAQ4DP72_AMBAM